MDGFNTKGQPFFSFGAVFKHVTLRGKIGDVVLCNYVLPDGSVNPPYQEEVVHEFAAANAEYYRQVDWALDISEAVFKDCEIRGIPAHLIRRDPESQAIITREKALEGKWRELEYRDGLVAYGIQMFLDRNEDSHVLIAPKGDRKYKDHLEDLQILRKAGVLEPD